MATIRPPSMGRSIRRVSRESANAAPGPWRIGPALMSRSCFKIPATIEDPEIDQRESERDQADRVGIGIAEPEVEILESRQVRLPGERGRRRARPAGGQHVD